MSRPRYRKDVADLLAWASAQYAANPLGYTRGGHVALGLPNGERVILPATASDRRSVANARAQIRRSARLGEAQPSARPEAAGGPQ